MRIAYVNINYKKNHTGGGQVHIEQFVKNAIELGHEIWTYPNSEFVGAQHIPTSRLAHLSVLRQMDALYIRIEGNFTSFCTWSLPPRRILYGFPVVIWEFNTIPEYRLIKGQSQDDVQRNIEKFINFGNGCDLGVCMTSELADYVHDELKIDRVFIAPNGSDPNLFKQKLPAPKRMVSFSDHFNVVWIGSGKIAWHDFAMLTEAAQIISDKLLINEISFHIIGPIVPGIMRDMPSNVYYWGAERYSDLPIWLANMDVGLSLYKPGPADYATPLKVFDYMASGLVVISTDQPFMKRLFAQMGQSDLLVPPGKSNYLANLIIKLSTDKARVSKLGMVGRQLIKDQYNWHNSVKKTLNKIEEILKEKGKN